MRGNPAHDTIHGFAGDDTLIGLGGNDSLHGGRGDDVLLGGRSGDLLLGGPGNDRIDGRDPERRRCSARLLASARPADYPPCVDVVVAGPGNDLILLRDGRFDAVWFCGRGRDTVIADRVDELADCEIKRR